MVFGESIPVLHKDITGKEVNISIHFHTRVEGLRDVAGSGQLVTETLQLAVVLILVGLLLVVGAKQGLVAEIALIGLPLA